MKKILVVNVNWVGDVVLSTPVFKALKDNYPEAFISCLAVPRVREILERSPGVDRIISYDEKGIHKTPWAKLKLIAALRREHFDAAFILHRSLTRALLIFLAGIPQRIGYATKNRGWLLTRRIFEPVGSLHRSDYYLKVIEAFNIRVNDRICELKPGPRDKNIEDMLRGNGITEKDFLVVVHVGGNWDLKRWPQDNFALLIKQLASRYQAKIVIPGTREDIGLAQEIARASGIDPVLLAGKTNLKELMTLMERADLVISSDSGPVHIANSLGVDVVGIFGPTRPEVTAPRGKGRVFILQKDVGCNRHPCYFLQCPDNVCMQAITVQDVLETIEKIRN